MGELKQHNMKTLLLLSILGLALVSADLQTEEDRYTEEADVVAVDDSAEAMDDLDDNTRRSGSTSRWAKFRFGDDLTADIKVRQSNSEKEKNNARWTSKLNKFNDDICPGGELNWHVHQYPVSETASSNIRRASPMTAQIENFNIQHAPITYFASDSGALKGGLPAPYLPTTVTGSAATSITSDGKIRLDWTLTGLDDNSSGGIHIHYGTTCDTEATVKGNAPTGANLGHYYVPDATPDPSEDPWTTVMWKSYADGDAEDSAEFTEDQLGAAPDSAFNRVVIVHNRNGKKVACGVLAPFTHRLGVGRSLKWHIHDKWTHTDKTDAYGADDCGPAFTGGHWDPTFQCSSASDNSLEVCKTEYNKNPPAAGPALYPCDETTGRGCNYVCDPDGSDLTMADTRGCELGDLTGKGVGSGGTGLVVGSLGPQRVNSGHSSLRDTNSGNIEQFAGKSIVFHCGGGRRAGAFRVACAQLN